MEKRKRQSYKDGMIVAIPVGQTQYTYGIAIYFYVIQVHDFLTEGIDESINWEKLKNTKVIFQVSCHKSVFSAKGLSVVKYDTITKEEAFKFLRPTFTQDVFDYTNCEIFFMDSREPSRKVSPEECIGLDRGVFETNHIIERVQCYYEGRKYSGTEFSKVITSPDDARLSFKIRWDKEKEEWVSREEI